jgi:hypothetical protein
MTDQKRDLAQRSDKILDAIDERQRLEKDKRGETISAPPFHHEIFEMAYRQEGVGDATETADASMRDVEEGRPQ